MSPKIMTTDIGRSNSMPSPDPINNGSTPRIVVAAVMKIGRILVGAPFKTASFNACPFCIRCITLSNSKMALLTTTPIKSKIPIKLAALNG